MKKIFSTLLALSLLLTGTAFAADASTTTDLDAKVNLTGPALPEGEAFVLQGVVTAIDEEEGCFLMTDAVQGDVQVNLGDDTVLEGTEVLALGGYVFVQYSGAMTFSLPPQVYGERITAFALHGTVTEVLADGFLLESEESGLVEVRADEAVVAVLSAEQEVTVFYDGVMTASLPGQVNAALVRTFTLNGVVQTVEEGSFLLLGDDGAAYEVLVSEDTQLWVEAAEGLRVGVSYSGKLTRSIPAQLTAWEIYPLGEKD